MLFLNTWMLLGLLGIAIPVIIHLLNRRQSKHVDWGAMIFLLDSLTSRRRRVLLEEILLLAARCLLMALLALALARPFIPANSTVPWLIVLPVGLLSIVLGGVSFALWNYPVWRRRTVWAAALLAVLAISSVACERWLNLRHLGRGGMRDVALVIDGSSSMTMSIDGKSNFARAIQEATQTIETAPRGFAFSLLIGGSVPNVLTPAPMRDRKRLLQLLQEAAPVQGTMQAPDTLAVAAATLAQGDNPAKQIIMIGDGQSVGWKTDSPETWDHLREAFARLPAPPQVVLRRLPLPATIRNASLAGVTLSRQVIGTDRDVRIDVTVANTGTEAITPQDVRLTVGTKVQSNHALGQLAPGSSETVSFRHQFARAGTEVLRATVVANDELPGDDEAIRVVQVMDRLHVLVVDASPATRFLDRPSAFVALALMPDVQGLTPGEPGAGKPNPDFLVTPEVISAAEFAGRKALGDVRVVVLVDVPQLTDETAATLAAFTAQGGGLLVVTGGRAIPTFYNAWRSDAGTVMPLPLDRLVVSASETNRPGLDPHTFEHAALKPLAAASDLGSTAFERYWLTGPADAGVSIGARLANGVPFLAEHRYGRGCVLQVAAPMDRTAGNLVARQGFVPLVHELVYALARPVTANLNLSPARGATIQLAGQASALASDGHQGLRGEYFADRKQRTGGVVRIDPTVDFAWSGAPIEGLPAAAYWVQWTGSIAVNAPGTYKFFTPQGCDMSLWVNGRRILGPQDEHGAISLQTGRRYDLRIDYFAGAEPGGHPKLTVMGPNQVRQTLPSQWLAPVRGDAETWSSGAETLVQGPDRQPFPGRYITGVDGVALRIERNLVPGLYHAQVPDSILSWVGPLLDKDGLIPFSVLVDGNESRLATLTPEELQLVAKYVPFLTAASADDVERALGGKAFGRELWRMLALAALALLILEILLTRWIAIQRRTGEEGLIEFEEQAASSAQFREQLAQMRGKAPAERNH